MIKSVLLLLFTFTIGLAFTQDLFGRAGVGSKHYSSEAGKTNLVGVQASIGISKQEKSTFSFDFGYFPINTKFIARHMEPFTDQSEKDSLVNFSGKGVASLHLSFHLLTINRERQEFSLGMRVGFAKSVGNRNNTPMEWNIKDKLNSMSIGAIIEYHYYINLRHSLFVNGGVDLNYFYKNNSKNPFENSIIGLSNFTGFINIGYAFVFLRM
ncbi:MAG TPA: hypothetical protein VKY37_12270 [Brumimicrobium sp.]|nr:hypothetical protein [Brumimicrobium sp.]